ncbi:MAG: hypothetical protein U5K75_01295 [Ahrensia sp.]|nr:hypothetical protein [Ahrensia sp.]
MVRPTANPWATIGAALLSMMAAPSLYAADYVSEYSVSVIGLPVGTIGFKTTINQGTYNLNGSMKASGIAALFSSTTGNIKITGQYSDGTTVAFILCD